MAAVEVDGCKRALSEYLRGLEQATSDAVDDGLEAAMKYALFKIKAQTKRHTGDLEDKLVTVKISTTKGKLFDLSGHAQYIDEGTRPHTIRAKNTTLLKFKIGGQWISKRQVQHKGTAPRPFAEPASIIGGNVISGSLQRRADILAENFNK